VRARVSLIPPSCTVRPGALPTGANLESLDLSGRRHAGQVQDLLLGRLGQRGGERPRRGLGLARLPGARAPAAAAVDDQAVHRVGRAFEGRTYRGQRTEGPPLSFGLEEHLEHHAIAMLVPGPLDRA